MAGLSAEYEMRQLRVICEGYDAPSDPFILRDSCGVREEGGRREKGGGKGREGGRRGVEGEGKKGVR